MRYRYVFLVLILFATLASTACSKKQMTNFVHDLCRGAPNCTNYGKSGEPTERWDP
jgi:hypothetical protein